MNAAEFADQEPNRHVPRSRRARAKLPSRRTPRMLKLTAHFDVFEFHCHDGTRVPRVAVPALKRLCRDFLEPMRTRFGACTVLSGYRTRAHNRKVGGVPSSQHLYELTPASVAADVKFKRGTVEEWARFADGLGRGGIGRYPRAGFVHVDNGPEREWTG